MWYSSRWISWRGWRRWCQATGKPDLLPSGVCAYQSPASGDHAGRDADEDITADIAQVYLVEQFHVVVADHQDI
jgi:hypothetical protein